MFNYIISLTTIPSKFDNLYITMDTLVQQTMLPSKIIINIPKVYNFRLNNCEIPKEKIDDFINKYSKFNVVVNLLNKDYGPGTKLLGILNNTNLLTAIGADLGACENTYIILVDDDIIYKPYMIENFDTFAKLNNTEVGSYWVYPFGTIQVGQGVDGFFIKLNILDKFLAYYNAITDLDYVHYHDDFYISYYFLLLNKNIASIKTPTNCLIYETHSNTYVDALCNLEGKYARQNLNYKSYDILHNLNDNGYFDFLHT